MMFTNRCPLGGDCGGTGWLWSPGRDYPDPEPPEWYPCECNPHAAGDPHELMDYDATATTRPVVAGDVPEPF